MIVVLINVSVKQNNDSQATSLLKFMIVVLINVSVKQNSDSQISSLLECMFLKDIA